jgi:predicted RNase H-like HicB family nuclease
MAEKVEEKEARTYTAVLTPGEDGWILAQVAEVPEAISQGRTPQEARANVTEALEAALAWRRDEGEELPERAEVSVTPVTVTGP